MDIKYVEVPIRVKPHKEYLDMKGVDALWEQIKEYVREHGGENTQGSVNADEVNAIIQAYYAAHKDELKGEPFTFEDLTEEQIEALRGADGAPGKDGYTPVKGVDYFDGKDGTVAFEELTEEQVESLRGPQGLIGETGAAFTYDMFTPEQLEALRGPKGADGTMTFSDLTDEQRESLRGPQGEQGPVGPAFLYSDFTREQLEALRGPKGERGETFTFDMLTEEQRELLRGPQGVQGIPGKQGEAAKVDYTLVYTRTEVDELLKSVDVNIDDINLENYYAKDETYNKEEVYNRGQIDNLISSLVIEGAAGVHIGDDEPTIAGVSVWVDTDGVPYTGQEDLAEIFYRQEYIDNIMETHVHRLSEMENDIGFVTTTEAVPTKLSQLDNDCGYVRTENVYKKPEVYTKTEVLTTLADYWKKSEELPADHVHMNKNILDKMYELNGNLMYNGIQVSGPITGGDGVNIDLSAYALQSNVNQQIDTVANAKVDKTTYEPKMVQVDASLTSLDGRITSEAEARVLADNGLSARIKTLEDSDFQTEADVLLLIQNNGGNGGEVNVDLTGYAKLTDIPDVSGFITQVPSEYITETELNERHYTKGQVDAAIDAAILDIEIPDVSAFQTEAQVIALIEQYAPAGGAALPSSEEVEF